MTSATLGVTGYATPTAALSVTAAATKITGISASPTSIAQGGSTTVTVSGSNLPLTGLTLSGLTGGLSQGTWTRRALHRECL